jgi:YD repeat-containing protein
VSTTNPLGAIGTAVYDGANKMIAQVDALGNRTSFSYDAANNRTALVDPLGNEASSVFDSQSRRIANIDPDLDFELVYNLNGRTSMKKPHKRNSLLDLPMEDRP